ncbi:NB-ARC domain-containing protein [Cephalotus follicularis]|uniref:NB-ARC domain-containing protein n=1 Tax=Cephalotus follicularis TaxID=3775 RepID=A0A1Q3DK29_CEPFO|nr:NB-ARC domain-containing protein [Cephalotus follicularis]
MADPLVSAIMEQLVSISLKQAEQQVRLVVGVDKQVEKLTSNLQAIQGVLEDAERKQVKEVSVAQWLCKLKDVSYEIDDVLDEWNTSILKLQIVGAKPKWKVCFLWCARVPMRHKIAVDIEKVSESLDDINNEKSNFNFNVSTSVEHVVERNISVSVIDKSEVCGRGEEVEKIVGMLLGESSEGPPLHIISIIGMGGVGKTTVAQLVYNDQRVEAHFEKKIWVCVSDPFDEIRIAKAILEGLERSVPNLNELESLLQAIRDSVGGKKFLMVLDDVWTEKPTSFEQLKNSLKCGLPGSRILVTTRKQKVARIIGTTDMIPLKQLTDKECLSLFTRIAFFGRSEEECKYLKDISEEISSKCMGLPLAAKVLGGLLCDKTTRPEWESVLRSEVWELEEVSEDMFAPLLLSYYDLSAKMRRCFSYCAIFPKDYILEKDRLIKLWMAQGFLKETPSRDMEMDGEECFNNLAKRSFFQDFENDDVGTVMQCKMHDIVHDFAQFLTKNECLTMELNGPEESVVDSSHVKARHTMMVVAQNGSIPTSICGVKKLRSLIVESRSRTWVMNNAEVHELFDHLTCLRSLELSAKTLFSEDDLLKQLPRSVEKLIHLRYLNLSDNKKLEQLPETVCGLFNLQSLNLNGVII